MKVVREGVYFLYDKDELVYIGQSDNLYRRIGQHIAEGKKKFDRFELYPTGDRIRLEGFLISMFEPKYNIARGADCVFGRTIGADIFPDLSVKEAIDKYDSYMGDPMIKEIAECIGTYQGALLRGLEHAKAPIYKIDGRFRLDKKWYEAHIDSIWDYVE